MWSVGRYDLGLSENEFWSLTPKQFKALCDRLDADYERDYWRAGLIASTIANVNRDAKKRPQGYKVEEFMPQKPKRRKRPLYTEEQKRTIATINTLLGIGAKRGRS